MVTPCESGLGSQQAPVIGVGGGARRIAQRHQWRHLPVQAEGGIPAGQDDATDGAVRTDEGGLVGTFQLDAGTAWPGQGWRLQGGQR